MAGSSTHGDHAPPEEEGGTATADVGLVGEIESIDPSLIELLLSRNFTPVVMPIGSNTQPNQ